MPYKIKGKSVVKADTGKLVGKSNNPKKYLRTLQAVEHGWEPKNKIKPTKRFGIRNLKSKKYPKKT